jgi:uncharacterized protein
MLFMTRLAGLAFAAIMLHSHAAAQAVDCRDAYSPDELTVCERPNLKALDSEVGQLYERALGQAHADLHYLIREEQAAFERARNRCRTQQRCIRRLYAARIRELSGLLGEDAQVPAPPVQAGCSLFRDRNFAGERIFINPNEQMSFWGTNWDNAVSSVRIAGNCRAVLYTRALFNGTDQRFSSDTASLGEANDRASSAQCICQ